jgi:amidohydrolase
MSDSRIPPGRFLRALGWSLLGIAALTFSAAGAASAQGARSERPDFAALATRHAAESVADRQWLHRNPELSFREAKTQAYLRERLDAVPGLEPVAGEWATGLAYVLRGGRPGPLLAWRADIDALPIEEETGLPFASTARDTLRGRDVGVMHACGHDVHAAVLLGIARSLAGARADLPGSVLFIVQPAEEIGAGADSMIRAGVLSKAGRPEAIFAIHANPTLLTGQVGYCPGWAAANVDDFRIRVLGRGGHGAYPHKTIDPVVIAAQMVLALQAIRSREVDTADHAVITVGSIRGGTTSNVIPDEVELHGTVRSLDPEVRAKIHDALLRTVKGIAAAAGAPEPEIRYGYGTPSLYNDPQEVGPAVEAMRAVLGADNVIEYESGMGGEDFSYFEKELPGFMWRLGVGRPGEEQVLHSSTFNPDEQAIPIGIRLGCEVLWSRMLSGTRGDRTATERQQSGE